MSTDGTPVLREQLTTRIENTLTHRAELDGKGLILHFRMILRDLPFAAGGFDGVVMLFSSFGYFDDAGNARVLDEVARVRAEMEAVKAEVHALSSKFPLY